VVYSPDREVQLFVEEEIFDFNPYAPFDSRKSASMVLQAARDRFTDYRCIDFIIWQH
jgi:hypothetical protein